MARGRRNSDTAGVDSGLGLGIAIGAALVMGIGGLLSYFTEEPEQTANAYPPMVQEYKPPPPPREENDLVTLNENEEDVPINAFYCPITQEIMRDPVNTPYGHCYERSAILRHLAKRKTDPLTNQPLSEKDLVPSFSMRNAIQEYRASLHL